MALGNKILLTNNPRGRFVEYVISGTPKPGTCMQVTTAEPDVGNRETVQVYDKSGSGKATIVCVLLEDIQQGKGATDAYTSGKRGLCYYPLPGDELNMIIGDVAGTGATSDFSIGDPLMIQDGTGKLIDALVGTASALSAPFECRETVTDLAADTLTHVIFTGY